MTELLVSQNLLYFQKMHCPRKTKPKKKGMTPIMNIMRLPQAFDNVDVIRFRFWLYSRYFSMVIQANIAPKPINVSFLSNTSSLLLIDQLSMATTAPMNWKKLPLTPITNQISKNFNLSKNPNSCQFLSQSIFAVRRLATQSGSTSLFFSSFIFLLYLMYSLDISQI